MYTDFRLKFRHWIKKYGKILFIAIIIWGIIFLINLFLKNQKVKPEPITNFKPHTAVLQDSKNTPTNLQKPIEDMLKKYIDYCNDGNYKAAYDMLSEECKEVAFENKIEKFVKHVLVKMPLPKKYSIQSYSQTPRNNKMMYVYEVRYYDDFLASGLTNTEYSFTTEKFTFNLNKDGKIEMNAGDYIYAVPIKNISENEYLKIDVMNKIVRYSVEEYEVKFTNRSNYIVIVSDDQELNEIRLVLPNETRDVQERPNIVLYPQQSITMNLKFPKFADDGDNSKKLLFSSVRVMEKYSGNSADKAVIQNEIDNAINKFSMEVGIGEK